jgi:alpha-glucoside transport system substrate-binding protein
VASTHRRLAGVTTAALLTVTAVTGCSSAGRGATEPAPTQASAAVTSAADAAHAAARGKKLGGTIDLLGVLSGAQLQTYLGTLKPFEDATGVRIKYESTGDVSAVLQTRIAGGNPPDVVSNASAGQMHALARQGKLVSLDDVVDTAAVKRDYPAGLVDLASANGHLYGIFYNSAVQGLVWYDPKTYTGPKATNWSQLTAWTRQSAASGRTPWCIGLESGPASGWPGAVWVEQFMLQQAGGDAYDQWWQGKLSWTSPGVKRAFQSFGAIATEPKFVSGGPTAVLTTSFDKSPLALFTKPPHCYLHVQADFLGQAMAGTVPSLKPVEDINFFPFPAANAGPTPAVETSGEMLAALKDTPQTQAFMRYVSSPAFNTLVAGTGQWIAANRKTPLSAYTAPLSKHAASVYASATTVRYTAQNSMPLPMSQAFLKAVLAYVKHPADLDAQLARLDKVRTTAYATN